MTMTQDQVFERMVPFIIARGEEVTEEDVTLDLRLEDVNIDSIKLVGLIGDLERELGFKVPASAMKDALPETVGELHERVVLRLREAGFDIAA